MRVALALLVLVLASASRVVAQPRDRLVDLGTLGDAAHPPRRVVAWVPREHDGASSPLPVLYVHDGQAAFTASGGAPGTRSRGSAAIVVRSRRGCGDLVTAGAAIRATIAGVSGGAP